MNKQEYLNALARALHKLPPYEREEALRYYSEYISDSGDEAAAIAKLPHPNTLAAQITAEYAANNMQGTTKSERKSGTRTALLVIMSIFAAPIALPLAAALVAVAFALLMALFAVGMALGAVLLAIVVTFGALLIAFVAGGIASFYLGITMLFTNFATGIFFIGAGLVLGGIALLCYAPFIKSIKNVAMSFSATIKRMFVGTMHYIKKKLGGKRYE